MHGNMPMIMKLCLLVSLCCFANGDPQVYYITPNHGNCTVNGMALHPCYTLQQLIEGKVLSSSKESSVELLLLTGTHLIPKGQILNVTNFSQVAVHPWNEEQKVAIKCELTTSFDLETYLVFQDITELNISLLTFTSCVMQWYSKNSKSESSVKIEKCVFQSSKKDGAITIIAKARSNLNVFLTNCTFLSNHVGAVGFMNEIDDTFAFLQIKDTLFHGNGKIQGSDEDDEGGDGALQMKNAMLEVINCQFINNTSGSDGGAIGAESSSLVIDNTKFYNNYAFSGSSISVTSSSLNISNCHFMENMAKEYGGISIQGSYLCAPSNISNSIFERNRAGGEGGFLYLENTRVTACYLCCQFKNNSARSGSSLYIKSSEEECMIINSTFIFNKAESDGGAIYCKDHTYGFIVIRGGYSSANSAEKGSGGFAYLANCQLSLFNHNISGNRALNGGAIYAHTNVVFGHQMKEEHMHMTHLS